MSDKHEIIVQAVITDFSVNRIGRMFKMMQGSFRHLYDDGVITISPYPANKGAK